MALQHCFECPLPEGVHARPASALEELARTFASEVMLVNQRTGAAANSKSVLAIIGADIRFHDPCMVTVSGTDEKEAIAKISSFVARTLPHCDDMLPPISAANGAPLLPPGLRKAGVTVYRGTAVVHGIGLGRVVRPGEFKIPAALAAGTVADTEGGGVVLDAALATVLE